MWNSSWGRTRRCNCVIYSRNTLHLIVTVNGGVVTRAASIQARYPTVDAPLDAPKGMQQEARKHAELRDHKATEKCCFGLGHRLHSARTHTRLQTICRDAGPGGSLAHRGAGRPVRSADAIARTRGGRTAPGAGDQLQRSVAGVEGADVAEVADEAGEDA